jgi:hypothetical protein
MVTIQLKEKRNIMSGSKTIGRVSVVLAVGAIILPFLLVLFPALRSFAWIHWILGPYMVWALELVSFILGIISWRTIEGKIGIIVSVLISILLYWFIYYW